MIDWSLPKRPGQAARRRWRVILNRSLRSHGLDPFNLPKPTASPAMLAAVTGRDVPRW